MDFSVKTSFCAQIQISRIHTNNDIYRIAETGGEAKVQAGPRLGSQLLDQIAVKKAVFAEDSRLSGQ